MLDQNTLYTMLDLEGSVTLRPSHCVAVATPFFKEYHDSQELEEICALIPFLRGRFLGRSSRRHLSRHSENLQKAVHSTLKCQ